MSRVVVGSVTGSFGVKGWIKVLSFTDPPENILRYRPWWLDGHGESQSWQVISGHGHGKGLVVAALEGVNSPEQARELRGLAVTVNRDQFPPAAAGEYYQVDLIGLTVRNLNGVVMGVVRDIMQTGANDVLIVEGQRERLIPFVQPDTVRSVDLAAREIEVDWDEDF
jgi:16S rRNA processing protein RimM